MVSFVSDYTTGACESVSVRKAFKNTISQSIPDLRKSYVTKNVYLT